MKMFILSGELRNKEFVQSFSIKRCLILLSGEWEIYIFFRSIYLKCEHSVKSGNRKGNEKLKTQHRLENGVLN